MLAEVGRRVIAYGKPGVILADHGHYIGVVLDEDPKKRISSYHHTHEMQYGEMAETLPLKEWLVLPPIQRLARQVPGRRLRLFQLQRHRRRSPEQDYGRVEPHHRGHALFCHYQQGLTEYLAIALVQETEAVIMTEELHLMTIKHLDLGCIRLAARINISEWQNNSQSQQYVSYLKGKQGRKVSEYFRDFIGYQEGVDGPSETRTRLKAFSDFVEGEDMIEESAREKASTLVNYSMAQAKLGELITLDELSGLIDEDRPKSFYDFIKANDYGLSEILPPDKKILNKFRRYTDRAEGLSISFDATLTLRKLPT